MCVAESVYSILLQKSYTCDLATRDADGYQWYLGRAAHDNDWQSAAAGAAAAGGGNGSQMNAIVFRETSN